MHYQKHSERTGLVTQLQMLDKTSQEASSISGFMSPFFRKPVWVQLFHHLRINGSCYVALPTHPPRPRPVDYVSRESRDLIYVLLIVQADICTVPGTQVLDEYLLT